MLPYIDITSWSYKEKKEEKKTDLKARAFICIDILVSII